MNPQPMSLSLGKRRGLQQCASSVNTFCILALDHRRVIRDAFADVKPAERAYRGAVEFKQLVVRALAPAISAVLLDPFFGAGPAIAANALPGNLGLLVSVEESGYAGAEEARISRVSPEWGVNKIKAMGASAVKLLVYYHPDSSTATQMQSLVSQIAADCQVHDIALFLEPLSYPLQSRRARTSAEIRRDIIQSARDLTPLGGEVLKVEFPLDSEQDKDEALWLEACQELNAATRIPWVLLSAATSYETFKRQTLIACQAGASGVLAGRSVWKEALRLPGSEREQFLATTALRRMQELRQICDDNARPYLEYYPTETLSEDWMQAKLA